MKILKKIMVVFMLVSMLFNSFEPVFVLAEEISTNNQDQSENEQIKGDFTPKGNIEVEMHFVLPIKSIDNIIFKISDSLGNNDSISLKEMKNDNSGYLESSISLGKQKIRTVLTKRNTQGYLISGETDDNNIVYLSINLYSLDKGDYNIEFSGNNFVTYSDKVSLDKFSKRISITDENGMFAIGDITKDNLIDKSDADLMLLSIEENNLAHDLNLDGVTDIADLNYITAILTGKSKTAKQDNTSAIIDSDNVSFTIKEENLAQGSSSINSLFEDNGVVRLQPSNKGEISANNPINLGINLAGNDNSNSVEMSQMRLTLGSNMPTEMTLNFETNNGTVTKVIKNGVVIGDEKIDSDIHPFTDDPIDGTIVIDLGDQIAVKKVTIVITETSTGKLADIAKVEFLNNVKMEVKEPDNFYTPKNITADTSVSEQITVHFNPVPNVTGYEIKVVGPKKEGGVTYHTTYNNFVIEDLKNYATYTISVRSVNQEWRSDWDSIEAIPTTKSKPPVVNMFNGVGTYSGIDFTWKNMDDTKLYNLYYREVGTDDWKVKENIEPTGAGNINYYLRGLLPSVIYEAYVTGINDNGEGPRTSILKITTLEQGATETPKYKLINDYNGQTKRTNHIKDVIFSMGQMIGGDNFSMVDDDFLTYWEHKDWEISASNGFDLGAPIFVLDSSYKMDEMVIVVPDSYFDYNYKTGGYENQNDILVHYWNDTESYKIENKTTVRATLQKKYDKNKRQYYVLKLADPIVASAVQFGLTELNNNRLMQISDVKFYNYDSLVDDTASLFEDDLRLELDKSLTKEELKEKIEELRQRANTMDNGEYSPYRDSVLADLNYATQILNDEKIDDIIELNPNISNQYNNNLGFAMKISDYQPLGIVARPGETLTVYVGTEDSSVNAEIVFTQYHAEADAWQKTSTVALKKGQNTITVPLIGTESEDGNERGGSVYIRYKNKPNLSKPIKVRVSGGTKIPVLDISLLTSEKEKKEEIKNYIEKLETYNASLEDIYASEGKSFDAKKSALGSTEIVTEYGLLSVSSVATQAAIDSKTTTIDEKVDRLYESTLAFDEMMEMFYRHKGLSKNAAEASDEMPKARINIRYMTMFYGAFMYAGGYHIGIEYDSIAGLMQASRNTDNKTGYFGWGISHEIGHQINQSNIVYAEVTNNVYALLAQTSNDKDKSRLEESEIYDQIYDKVTSHTLGRSQNVFVQLGMYWQLHLAYDDNKTFSDENSIYSRINKISRTYKNTEGYSKDDLLILFASKAANKNLINFFETWGLKASDKMVNEINALELEEETRAIYYLNDQARRNRLADPSGLNYKLSSTTKVDAKIVKVDNDNKTVTLSFNLNNVMENDKVLGFEILRNGQSIGFVNGDTHEFIDRIGAENNRAYNYEVIAYDYLLNKTEPAVMDEVKIASKSSVAKDKFTIESNVSADNESINYEDETMDYTKFSVNNLIDNNNDTFFNGTKKIDILDSDGNGTQKDNGNAYVIINLNDKLSISGIEYKAATKDGKLLDNTISNYIISVSSDKKEWTKVVSGKFNLTSDNEYTDLVYFMKVGTTAKNQLWTYNDVAYVKIEAVGSTKLSGAEINIISPPGDNVDISMDGENPVIGILDEDFCYLTAGCKQTDNEDNSNGIIKKGSVIIKGTYRGDPAFNNILIGDAKDINKLYSGYGLIFASVNDDNSVYSVANGTWIYVMEKDEYEKMVSTSSSIRAYLKRVNDAITLEGERLTSTSKSVGNLKHYDELGNISIKN